MDDSTPPLRYYLGVLRRQAWLIALVTTAGIAIAAATTQWLEKPVYQASMKIVVGQGGGVFQPQDSVAVQPLTQTMTDLLKSDIVATTVIRSLGLDMTPQQLLDTLQATSNPESSVLDLSYDSTDKRRALTILDNVGVVFTSQVRHRLTFHAPTVPGVNPVIPVTATVFDPAHLDPGQVSPRPKRSIAIAAGLGLAIGIILAFVREALDDRLRGRLDAERWFRAPVIGTLPKGSMRSVPIAQAVELPRASNGSGDVLAPALASTVRSPEPHAAPRPLDPRLVEAMSLLRANLEFSRNGARGPILGVTSATANEGKAAAAAAIAVSLAAGGHDVICVETDPRTHRSRGHRSSPGLADLFLGRHPGDEHHPPYGLTDILFGNLDLDDVLVDVELDVPSLPSQNGRGPGRTRNGKGPGAAPASHHPTRLRLLLSGRAPRGNRTLNGARLDGLLRELRDHADFAVLDVSPLLVAGDAFPLLRRSNDIVVVARAGATVRANADAASAMLDGLGLPNVSVVVTDATFRDSGGYRRPPRVVEAIKTYFQA